MESALETEEEVASPEAARSETRSAAAENSAMDREDLVSAWVEADTQTMLDVVVARTQAERAMQTMQELPAEDASAVVPAEPVTSTLPSTQGTSTLDRSAIDPDEVELVHRVSESDGAEDKDESAVKRSVSGDAPKPAVPTPRAYARGYRPDADTPPSDAVSEMSVDDAPMAGVDTFDLTASQTPRPGMQSEMPAPGAAVETQAMQIDGREAPMVPSACGTSSENGEEPEPEGLDQEDEPDGDVVPVVTPILTAEQVMDMCTGAGRQDLTAADLCRYNLQMCCPYLPPGGLPDDDALLLIIAKEEVQFAQGDSDDETIRDRDDTKEERVWHGHLRPY